MDPRLRKRVVKKIIDYLEIPEDEYPLDPQEEKRKIILPLIIGLGLVAEEVTKILDATIPLVEEVEEYWVLGSGGKSGENCPICIGFYNMGGRPLGYFPEQRAHTTYCEEYCTCHMEYSDGEDHSEVERYIDWQDWEMNRGFAM
jgi:hypothetical protein